MLTGTLVPGRLNLAELSKGKVQTKIDLSLPFQVVALKHGAN